MYVRGGGVCEGGEGTKGIIGKNGILSFLASSVLRGVTPTESFDFVGVGGNIPPRNPLMVMES